VFESPDGKIALVCGDVSGKGIPAALLMGVLHGAVRSVDWYDSPPAHEAATRRLNRMLCDRASDARFACLFWGYYDARSERLHYINAGHCAPLLVRPCRESTEVRTLSDGGPVLGLLRGARFEQSCVDIGPGDLLILYSDGVVEATNANGEEFGEERLRSLVAGVAERTPDEIRTAVAEAVLGFTQSTEVADDLTLLAVRFGPDDFRRNSDSVLNGREVLTA
jgi:sigma-B regulation protein RsbU (phosphoserine phosphatase)